jgi:hypothetical protein
MHAVFGAYLHLVRTMVPLKKILLVRIYFFEADISSKKKHLEKRSWWPVGALVSVWSARAGLGWVHGLAVTFF